MSTIELSEEQINKLVRQKLNEKQKKWYHGLPEEKRLELARKKVKCDTCDIELYYSYLSTHKKSKKHLNNEKGGTLEEKKSWYQRIDDDTKKEYLKQKYRCIVCDKDVLRTNKSNHQKTTKHKDE
jgi:hypothetical protein